MPDSAPNAEPSSAPHAVPNAEPSSAPHAVPSSAPHAEPSSTPHAEPSSTPPAEPSSGRRTAVELIRAPALSDVAEYAYAATAPPGARLIFLAGACPLNDDGTTAAVGDYARQAAVCLANLVVALEAAGARLDDVISTRVLVASSRQVDLGAAWKVVRAAFGDHDVPSTLMGVTVLGYNDQLVEIEAIAAVVD